jgi:hypothetical protein
VLGVMRRAKCRPRTRVGSPLLAGPW